MGARFVIVDELSPQLAQSRVARRNGGAVGRCGGGRWVRLRLVELGARRRYASRGIAAVGSMAVYGPGLRGNLRRWSDATRGPGPYFGGHENVALFRAPARLRLRRLGALKANFQVPRARRDRSGGFRFPRTRQSRRRRTQASAMPGDDRTVPQCSSKYVYPAASPDPSNESNQSQERSNNDVQACRRH